MGVVYEANDSARNMRVALKTLPFVDPVALYRFKQEFRSLANIAHPNLISLYEFFAEGDLWFFTMEFIEGAEFSRSVRSSSSPGTPPVIMAPAARKPEPESRLAEQSTQLTLGSLTQGLEGAGSAAEWVDEPGDPERIRTILRQVASGLCSVHSAGKLHRDMKSSNVLVTADGRAVVLDFGLALEFEEANLESLAGGIVGTVQYMAPEQGAGRQLSAASDWYSVGVMLYEALTGKLPYHGTVKEILQSKQCQLAPPPSTIVATVPKDLDSLCIDLLRIRPEERPSGEEVLERLDGPNKITRAAHATVRRALATPMDVFVGRENEQRQLHRALTEARAGIAAVALVHGPSGMGKSMLLQHFLEHPDLKDTLILRGRCYEQESVSYKAFDSAADALYRWLRQRSAKELQRLLPEDMGLLTQIFPVLGDIREIAGHPRGKKSEGDVQELRRRAFRAFRDLLARIQQEQQVVLFLDDLQWADVESGRLLTALLAPPNPPPLLLCCSFRSEYEKRSTFLQMLLSLDERDAFRRFDVGLKPLSFGEALEFAGCILATQPEESGQRVRRIAEESGGNPYFLLELVRGSGGELQDAEPLPKAAGLESIIWRRIQALPEAAQRLLYTVAVFGQPLAQADAYGAAGFSGRDPTPMNLLRYEYLVRTAGMHELDPVESFHDRIRETVVSRIAPVERRELHARLAHTLENTGRADMETLAVHFEGADETIKAAALYEGAAQQSSATLAFDRAAQLLESALRLSSHAAEKTQSLKLKLADALANAGRGVRAAREYESAAKQASPDLQLELERNAAFHFCSSGRLQDGLAIFHRVLGRVGLRISSNRKMTIVKFLSRSLWLQLRGARFQEKLPSEIPSKLLERIDSAWAVAAPMGMIDLLQGINFGTLCLLLALKAGDPARLVRATMVGAYALSVQGRRGHRLAEQLVELSHGYAEKLGDPRLRANVAFSRMAIAYICAEWRVCCREALEAEKIFTRECTGARFELGSIWTIYLYSLYTLGEFAELGRRCRPLLQDAEERDDQYTYANIEVFCEPLVLLAADRPGDARQTSRNGLQRWPFRGVHLQHFMASHAAIWTDFYEGRGAECFESVQKTWDSLRKNGFDGYPNVSTIWQDHLGRSALAVAACRRRSSRESADALAIARKVERKLASSSFPWAQATARVMSAGLAHLRGENDVAAKSLLDATSRFESQDMLLYAASARRRAGELMGGDSGRQLIGAADAWMRSQNIVRPDRMAAVHVGGYWDAD